MLSHPVKSQVRSRNLFKGTRPNVTIRLYLSICMSTYLYMHAFNLLAVVAAGFEIPTPRQSPKTADAGRLPPASWRRAVTMQSRSQL